MRRHSARPVFAVLHTRYWLPHELRWAQDYHTVTPLSQSALHRSHANNWRNRAVLETLEPLSGDRKCFRMINGVLAERTVKDVVPALKTNLEGLEKVLTELTEQYNTKTTEMEKWKASLVLNYHSVIVTD